MGVMVLSQVKEISHHACCPPLLMLPHSLGSVQKWTPLLDGTEIGVLAQLAVLAWGSHRPVQQDNWEGRLLQPPHFTGKETEACLSTRIYLRYNKQVRA